MQIVSLGTQECRVDQYGLRSINKTQTHFYPLFSNLITWFIPHDKQVLYLCSSQIMVGCYDYRSNSNRVLNRTKLLRIFKCYLIYSLFIFYMKTPTYVTGFLSDMDYITGTSCGTDRWCVESKCVHTDVNSTSLYQGPTSCTVESNNCPELKCKDGNNL